MPCPKISDLQTCCFQTASDRNRLCSSKRLATLGWGRGGETALHHLKVWVGTMFEFCQLSGWCYVESFTAQAQSGASSHRHVGFDKETRPCQVMLIFRKLEHMAFDLTDAREDVPEDSQTPKRNSASRKGNAVSSWSLKRIRSFASIFKYI